MCLDLSPIERFERWFGRAVKKLRELDNGDGGFAVLMIAIPLYERYINARLKLNGSGQGEMEVREEIAGDLRLNDHDRKIFWDIFRNGFTHQAMAKGGRTKWLIGHSYGELPELKTVNGQSVFVLDPWKFSDRILNKFRDDHRLITASGSYALADIFVLPCTP